MRWNCVPSWWLLKVHGAGMVQSKVLAVEGVYVEQALDCLVEKEVGKP